MSTIFGLYSMVWRCAIPGKLIPKVPPVLTAAPKPLTNPGVSYACSAVGRAVAERSVRLGGSADGKALELPLGTTAQPLNRLTAPALDERLPGTRFVSLTPNRALNTPSASGVDC